MDIQQCFTEPSKGHSNRVFERTALVLPGNNVCISSDSLKKAWNAKKQIDAVIKD